MLTPSCDPDMSFGAPFGAAPHHGPRLRSGAVLLVLAVLCGYLATADAVPAALAAPAAVVGLTSALVLVRRAIRLAHRAAPAAAAAVTRDARVRGRRPVGAAT
jgi:hypothetical protein